MCGKSWKNVVAVRFYAENHNDAIRRVLTGNGPVGKYVLTRGKKDHQYIVRKSFRLFGRKLVSKLTVKPVCIKF